MNIRPILGAHDWEQVLLVDPVPAPDTDAGWRHRLNLYPGRTLDEVALTSEQDRRAGDLALRGQRVSPGAVEGLEVALEVETTGEGNPTYFIHVTAGQGIAASGEDVTIPASARIPLDALPVWAPSAPPPETPPPADEEEVGPEPGTLMARQLYESFAQWRTTPGALPRAGILVLQPVEIDVLVSRRGATADSADDSLADPCEEDPSAFGFENWQRRDACRLVLCAWPTDWRPLPVPDERWRNRLAYAVFREESRRDSETLLPWEELGVPLALIGFDPDWVPLFVDGHSVARAGGKPKRRRDLIPGDNPFFWQARFDQLVEQLGDPKLRDLDIGAVAAQFRYLPPAGLLPRTALQPEIAHQGFFPSSYDIDAVPVPIEHLDVALEASASLAPFDLFTPDRVRYLVPVPQKFFEPRLLVADTVDPRFQQAITEAVDRRSEWLRRRENVRRSYEALFVAMTGARPAFPEPADDPGQLEQDEGAPPAPTPVSGRAHQGTSATGSHRHGFQGATATLTLGAGDRFVAYAYLDPNDPPSALMLTWSGVRAEEPLENRAYFGRAQLDLPAGATAVSLGPLPLPGRWVRLEIPAESVGLVDTTLTGLVFTAVDGRVTWARAGRSPAADPSPTREQVWVDADFPAGATPIEGGETFVWLEGPPAMTDPEPEFGTAETGEVPVRVARGLEDLTEDLKSRPITAGQLAALHTRGLGDFIALLEAAIDEANDQINFGYMRVQTAMYRLRQEIVGDRATDRFVTSPVLAQIAQETRSTAEVKKNLSDVFTQMQAAKPERWWTKDAEVLLTRAAPVNVIRALKSTKGPPIGGLTSAKVGAGAFGGLVFNRPSPATMVSIEPPKAAFVFPSEAFVPVTQPPPSAIEKIGAQGIGAVIPSEAIDFGGIASKVGPGRLGFETVVGGKLGGAAAIEPRPRPGAGAAPDLIEAPAAVADKQIRTTSIAERLLDSRAIEAKDFCAATKRDVASSLLGLEIQVDDLPMPGLALHEDSPEYLALSDEDKAHFKPVGQGSARALLNSNGSPARERHTRPLGEFRVPATLARLTASEPDPDDPSDSDAGYFAIGSDLLNHTTLLLRAVEGRVQDYRQAVERARGALDQVTGNAVDADRRLKQIEDELAEARHDVATDRALLAEEVQRIEAINHRRGAVLREHVSFLAYHRPRLADPIRQAPARPLDPGPTPSPVPACLGEEHVLAPELQRYVDLFRQAPANWFVAIPSVFDRFDRLESIRDLVTFARDRARVLTTAASGLALDTTSRLGRALTTVREAQTEVIRTTRAQRLELDLSALPRDSWSTVRQRAPALVDLGDLLDGSHGRSDVARIAGQELDNIAQVAGCLHRHFSEVLPVIRLAWAEALSQYDTAGSLRNLAVLSRWGEIDVLDRRELQGLVDWLFLQVAAEPAALSLVNDLVRSCLLLASHSPVDQLITGHVHQDTPILVGGRIQVTSPSPAVRVGMNVLLYKGADVIARAVVEDFAAGVAAARIVTAARAETLAQGARAQFTAASGDGAARLQMVSALSARMGR
ncbi:MAG: hypothetical protein ACJ8DC_17595 [Gemmatimonadales bacterium]